jgi:molybdopterin-containing oxidoreductase family iron-sulfur binding subunit
MSNGMDRRRFLKVIGVTGGGAAVTAGCGTDRVEKLIPHLIAPEQEVPSTAMWYASTCRECPGGCGLHVRVREGRAVKLEGNPDSPVNRGGLCARGQAGLQGLYNPDRLRGPMARTADGTFEPIPWEDAVARLAAALTGASGSVAFVTGHETGAFGALVDELLALFPGSKRAAWEPLGFEAVREANRLSFGRAVVPQYDFAAARYVLSFGADFLETWINATTNARSFSDGHAFANGAMGKLVYVDQRMGLTGMSADEWVAPVPGSEASLALAAAHVALLEQPSRAPADAGQLRRLLEPFTPSAAEEASGVPAETIERIGREFAQADGALAVAGGAGAQGGDALGLCLAVNLLNYVTGNVGRTVRFGPNTKLEGLTLYREVAALVDEMAASQVGVALFHGANPGHAFPNGARWREAMAQVPFKVSFASVLDETARDCDLLLPDHHPLEQWGDANPVEGVLALQQPVMTPVFDTKQTGDVLLEALAATGRGSLPATFKEYLVERWRGLAPAGADFDTFWHDALRDGGVYRDVATETVRLADGAAQFAFPSPPPPSEGLLAVAYPSALLYDGRGANRPWLQEIPDPTTKLAWHSWVEMHPETAASLGVVTGDIVELATEQGSLEAPALVYDAIRHGVLAIPLGQGHDDFGRYATGRGVNAFRLLSPEPAPSGGMRFAASVTTARNTGRHQLLATTEGSPRQHGREMSRAMALTAAAELGDHAAGHDEHVLWGEREQQAVEGWTEGQRVMTQFGDYPGEHPRWAMAIDLGRCTGCSACVAACYAENNIPVVGEDLVARGREMSWLRIERFWEGGSEGEPLSARLLPMLCQHCGNAPCEPVCPVFAAYHTPDGLNGQVYNRCVGTRYCANNCPYKVRYFNWFDYSGETPGPYDSFPEPLNWQLNPDVTVRTKGVMEKCTFCVQRIRERQHQAVLEDRPLADGEILTACQQTCPTGAIVFGDRNDPDSVVHHASDAARGYQVFAELNVLPAVTYLSRVVNRGEA